MLFLLSSALLTHNNQTDQSNMSKLLNTILSFFLAIIGIVLVVVAVLVASRCNPKHPIVFGVLAFLFPEIYLIQYGIRKYLLKQKGYCAGMPGGLRMGLTKVPITPSRTAKGVKAAVIPA